MLTCDYLNLPVLDLTAPSLEQLDAGVAFIQAHQNSHAPQACGGVYIHCKIGYSRSAAFVAAYALKMGLASTAEEAFAHLQAVRPSIIIRPEIHQVLAAFEKDLSPLS